jgi:tripartite-type tricarboxylate transporter receptor subunit TctC
MAASYMDAWKMSSDEFAAFVNADADKWEMIIAAVGIQAQ